jgi:hypothetical protein
MMLVASAPDRPWRSVFLSRGTGDDPVAAVDLVLPAPPEERLAAARRALGVVVACYRAGMREPLPLFPTFSLSVAQGAPDFSAWSGQDGRGDRAAPATAFFYGRMNGSDLLALDPVEGDPPGPGGRVQRWADYLWGAVAATSLESGR